MERKSIQENLQEKQIIKRIANLNLSFHNEFDELITFFNCIDSYYDDFGAVHLQFHPNGIRAKHDISVNQSGKIKHFGDKLLMENIPYVIFEYQYDLLRNNPENRIERIIQTIDSLTGTVINQIYSVNPNIITFTFDKATFQKFCWNIKKSKSKNDFTNVEMNLSREHSKDIKKIFLSCRILNEKIITDIKANGHIYCFTEFFETYNIPSLFSIKNFPLKIFKNKIMKNFSYKDFTTGEYFYLKFQPCMDDFTNEGLYLRNVTMEEKYSKFYLKFNFPNKNSFSYCINDYLNIYDNNFISNYLFFKKKHFQNFGKIIDKIPFIERYYLDWEFIRCLQTDNENNQNINFYVLRLIVKKNYQENTMEIGSDLLIDYSIFFFILNNHNNPDAIFDEL